MRIQIHFRKILIISCLLYGAFVMKYGIHSRDQAKKAVNLNARVIAGALWHRDVKTLSEYLLVELERHHYERIVVTDNKGENFIEKKIEQNNWIDRLLVSVKLIPLIPISADITHNRRVIGNIDVIWQCRTIYTDLYLFLALSLILAGLNFHARTLCAKNNLEDKVKERTIRLQKTNLYLKQSEERFRSLFETVVNIIFYLSHDGRIVEFNPETERLYGWIRINESDLKGKPFWEAPWWTHSPQLQQRLQTAIKRAADGKFDQFEAKHIALDSTIVYVDYSIKPVFDEHRNILYLVVEGYDVTNRKQIEEALAEQNRFLETLIDEIPISIFYKNTKGKYTGCNKHYTELLGLRKDKIIGRSVYEVHKKELADIYFEADKRLFENPGVQVYESQIDHSNGTRLDILINKATFFDKDGHVSGIIGAAQDISERKKAEREKDELESQLRQAQKMESIGTLAGGIAHDFNNILGAIMGFAELAQLDAAHGTVLKANLNEVIKAANRAKELINQILTFSRQSEQKLKPLQLSIVIKEALKLLRASLPSTIEIRYDIKSDALAMANPTQIHQVMMNLCTNAGHAMRKNGGWLEVSLTNVEFDTDFVNRHPEIQNGPYLQLTVTDTGHGMSSEILNRIFDPFFSTKETGEGTGLGLSVVHGIVKSHGGTIYAYSEPGKGSSFKVYFPAIERRLEPEKREEMTLPKGSERILFVDDEKMLVDVGKQLLETLGYDVTAKNSSIDALQLFTSHPGRFDLVITDQTMPHMTGEELATKLLVIRPDIPIIMCTGFIANITERNANELGIKSLIMKPIIMRHIAKTIRKVLDETYAETSCGI